ncbi:MDR family MFS transporter [Ruania alba]|uniref:MFS transporter, DHA2 family, lincomycin resistance protein n=1 Tax=Ruania alba TaxID=648782 RepID=A0A1H5G5L9_9MICO|nr:MDR family MFS transporter [Ruania alba]SEE10939.1 MFS transporter, DHA2 family, lincomycin resistance protein [Ruania alba]
MNEPADPPHPYAPTGRAAPTHLDSQTKLVIGLLLVSSFVVILNETIMSVAIPSIMDDLGVTETTGQWLSTAFMLTMAVVIPVTGYLLQRFHTRTIFLTAMTLFAAGTFTAAVSAGFGMLVLGRVIQASGTAMMLPLLMTTLMTVVPPALRGKTMGNVSIVMAVAPAVGPTVSGAILSVMSWTGIFWLVLPIAIAALVLGAVKVPNVTTPRAVPLDVLSVVLSALAFGGLIYGLSTLGEAAHGEPLVPAPVPLGIGVVMLGLFVVRQIRLQRDDRALLDLRVFSSRTFTVALTMMLLMMMSLFGTIILLPIYLQNVLGLEPLAVGAMLLPGGLAMGLLGPVAGRIYDRFGPRVLVTPGAIIVSAALWTMTTLTAETPGLMVLGVHVFLSLGLGLLFTPLFTTSLGSIEPHLYSHGSAIVGAMQQLAGAAGTALFVVLLTINRVAASHAGADVVHATAAGTRAAFLCGAVISLAVIVASFFIRAAPQPAEDERVLSP